MLTYLSIEIVLGLVAATWYYALFCGFVSDDHATIERRKDIIPEGEKNPRKETYWRKILNDGIIMYYSNKVMDKLSGKYPFGWHLLSYVLHIANTYLFYLVASQILSPEIALYAALIWGVNPMLNQAVAWCSGRPYLFATLFALVAILNWQRPYVVLPLYLLGIITNVSIVGLPLLLKLLHPGAWQGNVYLASILLAVPWMVWKFVQRFGKGALVLDRTNYQFHLRRLNNLVRVYVYYIVTIICPVKMGWYHESGFRYNEKWDGFNIWAVVGYLTTGLLIMQGVAGWWFLLGMIPNMNIFATNSYLQDRYVYFGSIGLALIAAPYLATHPEIFIALVAIYMVKSYTYSRHMINDEKLYRENWRNHPKSEYAVNNLGFFLIQQQRYDESRAIILRGIDINANNKLLWFNLGITYAAQGHLRSEEGKMCFIRALDCWKRALQIEPRWRKPQEDMQKLVKFLIENKVLTPDKKHAAPMAPLSVPVSVPS